MHITVLSVVQWKNGFVWYPAETDYANLDEVYNDLADFGCIKLTKLGTKRRSDGSYVVHGRPPRILGVAGIVEIGTLRYPVVDAEDAAPSDPDAE